jgi:hypothetical protein
LFLFNDFYKMNKIKQDEFFKWKKRSILMQNNKKNKL